MDGGLPQPHIGFRQKNSGDGINGTLSLMRKPKAHITAMQHCCLVLSIRALWKIIKSNYFSTSSTCLAASGAHSHIIFDRISFPSYSFISLFSASEVKKGAIGKANVCGHVDVEIFTIVRSDISKCRSQNISYLPDFEYSLMPVSTKHEKGLFTFIGRGCGRTTKGGRDILKALCSAPST